jgi:ATP-dependent DNA helicase RecG
VRLINKFPNAPNKDVGEGLNTAFAAMRKMRLRDPVVSHLGSSVLVTLRHESLATPEEQILEFLRSHESIANREARALTSIESENKMKRVLASMVDNGLILIVEGATRFNRRYRIAEPGATKDV